MIRFFRVAAGVLFALFTVASSAQAQQNQPVRSGNFYEDQASGSGSSIVNLTFAQSPADKFLNITRVACNFSLGGSGQALQQIYFYVGTISGSGNTGRQHPIDVSNYGASGPRFYSLNQPMNLKIGPGRFATLAIYAPGTGPSTVATCTIVGDLSDT